jgi:hypothetical protein
MSNVGGSKGLRRSKRHLLRLLEEEDLSLLLQVVGVVAEAVAVYMYYM